MFEEIKSETLNTPPQKSVNVSTLFCTPKKHTQKQNKVKDFNDSNFFFKYFFKYFTAFFVFWKQYHNSIFNMLLVNRWSLSYLF